MSNEDQFDELLSPILPQEGNPYSVFGMSTAEFQRLAAESASLEREREEMIPGFFTMDFGPWTFDPEDLSINHGGHDYSISFERITSSACILDWVMQVHGKEWADPVDVYALLVAFRRILHPQGNYCSFEQDKRASGKELAEAYAKKAIEHREEVLQIKKFQEQANIVLDFLSFEKPSPLSLLLESVDIPGDDVIATLNALEKIGTISFDREARYIQLIPQTVTSPTTEENPS